MFKTSIIYFLIRAVNGVLALTSIYALTRLLSAEQYGIYALGMAGIGLCASVLFQWIAVSVSRFYAIHAAEPDALLTEAYRLFFRIAATGLFITAIYATWSPMPAVTPQLAIGVGVGAIAMGLHNLGLQIANARGLPLRFGLLTASRGALALTCALAFVLTGFEGTGAVFGMALGCVLSVSLFSYRRKTNVQSSSPELRRQMLVYGLPLTITYFSTIVLDVSDRFMIGWWLGTPAVAGYAAAYDITQQVVGAIMNVLFLSAYPRVIAAWEAGGATAASQAMLPLSRAMLLISPLISGIFIGLAPDISSIALGAEVGVEAEKIIPWVAFGVTAGCFKSFYFDISFQIEKTMHIQVRITAMMAIVNVILNLILIPNFGLLGAAISTTAAFTLGTIASWWSGRHLGIYPKERANIIRMIFTFLAVIAAIKLTPPSTFGADFDTITRIIAGLTGYIAASLATNLSGIRSIAAERLKSLLNK
jgi:O-antigen/teichoic acid export membrane protein